MPSNTPESLLPIRYSQLLQHEQAAGSAQAPNALFANSGYAGRGAWHARLLLNERAPINAELAVVRKYLGIAEYRESFSAYVANALEERMVTRESAPPSDSTTKAFALAVDLIEKAELDVAQGGVRNSLPGFEPTSTGSAANASDEVASRTQALSDGLERLTTSINLGIVSHEELLAIVRGPASS